MSLLAARRSSGWELFRRRASVCKREGTFEPKLRDGSQSHSCNTRAKSSPHPKAVSGRGSEQFQPFRKLSHGSLWAIRHQGEKYNSTIPVVVLVMQARSFREDPLHSKPAPACPLPTMESLECSSTETGRKPGLCKNCCGIVMDSSWDIFACLFAGTVGEEGELPLSLPLRSQ